MPDNSTTSPASHIPVMNPQEFLRLFKDNSSSQSESRFCFIIGAGASVQSGIQSGQTLAKNWLAEIKEDLATDEFDTWLADKEINEQDPAEHYGHIYQKRFEHNTKGGHEALLKAMSNAKASIGYPLLGVYLPMINIIIILL